MDQQNPTLAKILILDTGKFEQWQFRIQQYLQHEHYALWEVIEFGDSYEAPKEDVATASDGSVKNKGRTVTVTSKDMQKRKNDVKARTTLLLSLLDEHQLRFTKHSSGNEEVNTASVSTASTNVSPSSANIGVSSIGQDIACAYIASQSNDVAGFDKSKVECFNCHKISHFARECRVHRSQDRGRRDNYRQGSKVEEQTPKALMAIDGVGWDWSFMENEQEDHALVADEEAPTEFALMAKTSAESEVFDNSLFSKNCKKNNESLNSKIIDLTDKLCGSKNMLFHYKAGLSQVECRLAEFKSQEIKFYEKIRGLEVQLEFKINRIESLKNELELVKKEKGELDTKLTGFQTASKNLDNLLESQKSDKNKEGLGYSAVPPPPAQVYSPPKKDMSWTGLPEFVDDTITDYSRPTPTVETTDRTTETKTSKVKTAKPAVKYAAMYSKPSKSYNVRRNQRNWNNLKSHQLGANFVMKKKACFNCVRSQSRALWVPTVNRNFPTVNRKFPTVNKKFPTGSTKFSTADMGKRETLLRPQRVGFGSLDITQLTKCSSQNNIDDKGYWDSGCSRHMTSNISYLSDYEPFDGGYVSFGQGGCKITGKGTIKTGKLEFENVYFVKDLKYNLFSVSQICDNKNIVLFTDSEYIVLGRDFKLIDDTNVLLRTPRQHNMYSIDLNNIVPHKDLTCLVAKASADECMLWHRRLGHLNFKTMNKLVRHNLVRGFTWTFFLKTKDETSGILRKFITEIENLKDLKLKIIRCDNGGEFRNKEMNDFCSRKGIKREFSNARTPQQNGVAERKLFNGRTHAIGFLKPFGCHVMILNTLDNLGKFKGKGDEGYFIRYFMSSKAFRVFNKRTKRVEENLHVEFLENKAIEKGADPNWLFDIDSLTKSINYVPVVVSGGCNQEVKKDVSFLRYIVLPNWVHDTLLESPSSNAQDTCKADAPKSSGNPNPTASTDT
nr:ribonuclease H-like domain-containing protein [Tanacetum cinerariifolium]